MITQTVTRSAIPFLGTQGQSQRSVTNSLPCGMPSASLSRFAPLSGSNTVIDSSSLRLIGEDKASMADLKVLPFQLASAAKGAPLRTYTFTYRDVIRQGVGFVNTSGGVQCYCPMLSPRSFTIGANDVTVLRSGHRCCYVFNDLLDYLFFLSVRDRHLWSQCGDVIIVNSPLNIVSTLIECDPYDTVYACFDDSIYGHSMFLTLKERHPGAVLLASNALSGTAFSALLRQYANHKRYDTTEV